MAKKNLFIQTTFKAMQSKLLLTYRKHPPNTINKIRLGCSQLQTRQTAEKKTRKKSSLYFIISDFSLFYTIHTVFFIIIVLISWMKCVCFSRVCLATAFCTFLGEFFFFFFYLITAQRELFQLWQSKKAVWACIFQKRGVFLQHFYTWGSERSS